MKKESIDGEGGCPGNNPKGKREPPGGPLIVAIMVELLLTSLQLDHHTIAGWRVGEAK